MANELEKTYQNYMRAVRQEYPPLIASILENLAGDMTVSEAVDKAFRDTFYVQSLEEKTVSATVTASGSGLGKQLVLDMELAPDYFLYTKFADGVNLSDTLHSGESQRAVKQTLKDYFKFKGNAQELRRKLGEVKTAKRVDLPKAIRELGEARSLWGTSKDRREFQTALNKAQRAVDSLNKRGVTETRQLQKAYQGIIDAVLTADDNGVQKALDYALNTKVDYINRRIGRTEFARAYEMSFQRQLEEDGVKAFEVVLSSDHPRPDICDYYAEADLYGMGEGVYPNDAGVNIPFHPNCLCSKVPVYDIDRKGRFSEKRAKEYLDSQTEYKRKQIVGAKYSENKNYRRGLEKQGFQITAKPRMISKRIIKPKAVDDE